MTFYSGLAATATKLLTEKGRLMIIRRKGMASSDPAAGTVTESPPVDYTVNGVLVGYKDFFAATDLVQRGDRKALIEAGVVTPTKEDQLIVDGRAWTIIDVEAVNPAGTPVLFKLQVRS